MLPHAPRPSEDDPALSIQTAARIYGCSEKTIRRRIAEGELPAFRLGPRLIRIRKTDLDALMAHIPTAQAG